MVNRAQSWSRNTLSGGGFGSFSLNLAQTRRGSTVATILFDLKVCGKSVRILHLSVVFTCGSSIGIPHEEMLRGERLNMELSVTAAVGMSQVYVRFVGGR